MFQHDIVATNGKTIKINKIISLESLKPVLLISAKERVHESVEVEKSGG